MVKKEKLTNFVLFFDRVQNIKITENKFFDDDFLKWQKNMLS